MGKSAIIKIKTQKGFDKIPEDFHGRIHINSHEKIIIRKKYPCIIQVFGNSRIEDYGGNDIVAFDNSYIKAYKNSYVKAYSTSLIKAYDNAFIRAKDNSLVKAYDDSYIIAENFSNIDAKGNSCVKILDYSSIVAKDTTFVTKINHFGHIKIVKLSKNPSYISTNNGEEIPYIPRDIFDFMDFYGIKHDNKNAIFYKAVHKTDNKNVFVSDWNNDFTYKIGKTKREQCDTNTYADCSDGIHLSTLNWAVNYGYMWDNFTIIECKTKIKNIVMPKFTKGKIRTSKIKVLREVPPEEYKDILKNIIDN